MSTSSSHIPNIFIILGGLLLTLPSLFLKFGIIPHVESGTEALLLGISILGAAFMMSWAAETAQMDISQGFALAILALLAFLPDSAVYMVFAWKAAADPSYAPLALANMTGANRLLIGIGWPMVIFLFFLFSKKQSLSLSSERGTEIFYLTCATIYAFTIPFKGSLSLLDATILIAIFFAYIMRTAWAEVEEPELVGPSAFIGSLTPSMRRFCTVILFLYAGLIIFLSAEPFAESLVTFGREQGIDEFLLVQWLAPLASEAPEIMIAAIWAIKGQGQAALGALISSKVNQWTLLVGTLPIVYSFSAGNLSSFTLDLRQNHEIWLTAGQSIFAVAILSNLKISWLEALLLIILFSAQLIVAEIRMEVFSIYLVLAAIIMIRNRKHLPLLVKTGLRFK